MKQAAPEHAPLVNNFRNLLRSVFYKISQNNRILIIFVFFNSEYLDIIKIIKIIKKQLGDIIYEKFKI